MRFLTTNLCTETATSIQASSANVNFPVSNLANPLRSKRWRSSGYFTIGSNNKIDFKESGGGSELTATVSAGNYTTSALEAAVKAALELVGAATYTVTFSSTTGLWTISSDGSYFSLLNATGTNEALSLLKSHLGYADTDLTGALTYTGELISIHTKEWVRYDFSTIQDINSVVIMWPKEDGIKLSSTAVLKVQANATDTWTSPAVDQTLTIDDSRMVASHFFSTPQNYRYWRVTIEDPQNPFLHVELGLVWIGENEEFSEPENGFKVTLVDNSVISRTDFGHEYVDEYPQIMVLDFNYRFIEYETAEILESAFRRNGIRKPVLVVFDETETVFNRNHFLIYGKMDKSFGLDHVMYNLFNGGLKVTELG